MSYNLIGIHNDITGVPNYTKKLVAQFSTRTLIQNYLLDNPKTPNDKYGTFPDESVLSGYVSYEIEEIDSYPVNPGYGIVVPDSFNYGSLDTDLWEVIDPLGGATITMTGNQLNVAVVGGAKHNMWTDDKNGIRIVQPMTDVDFVLSAQINTLPSARYHDVGVYAEEDANNNIRMAFGHNGTVLSASAVKLTAGTAASVITNSGITPTIPCYLRLTRSGDSWAGQWSQDNVTWYTHFTGYTHAINVAKVGLIVLNSHDTAATTPAFTGRIDWFQ